jgi:hypothetical protein
MTLQASGKISASNINLELNRTSTNIFDVNGTNERALALKTTPNSNIKWSDFYGKSHVIFGQALITTTQTYQLPASSGSSIVMTVIGGGGGGGGGTAREDRGLYSGGGGGGGGAFMTFAVGNYTPGRAMSVQVGAAGTAGVPRDGPYSGGASGGQGGTTSITDPITGIMLGYAGGGVGGTVSQPNTYVAPSGAGGVASMTASGTYNLSLAASYNGSAGGTVTARSGASGFTTAGLPTATANGGVGSADGGTQVAAQPGTAYGGGGGGGGCNNADGNGGMQAGAGSQGVALLTWGLATLARVPITLTISGYSLNPNILQAARATGLYVAGKTDIVLNITSTGVVGSASVGTPALNISGFATGDTVRINNAGYIIGVGGAGGAGGYYFQPSICCNCFTGPSGPPQITPPTSGTGGGIALSTTFSVTINNTGTIGGGGGGGGGGAGAPFNQFAYGGFYGGGGGGGGGYYPGLGNQGPSFTCNCSCSSTAGQTTYPYAGANGTLTSGGAGGTYLGYSFGGNGGLIGAAGQSGSSYVVAGGAGGGSGTAVLGNSNVTWVSFGTRLGAIN